MMGVAKALAHICAAASGVAALVTVVVISTDAPPQIPATDVIILKVKLAVAVLVMLLFTVVLFEASRE